MTLMWHHCNLWSRLHPRGHHDKPLFRDTRCHLSPVIYLASRNNVLFRSNGGAISLAPGYIFSWGEFLFLKTVTRKMSPCWRHFLYSISIFFSMKLLWGWRYMYTSASRIWHNSQNWKSTQKCKLPMDSITNTSRFEEQIDLLRYIYNLQCSSQAHFKLV